MCQPLPEECLPLRFATNDSTLTQVDILGDVSAAVGGVPPPEVRYFGIDTETSHEILQDLRNVTMPALGRGF
jgi:hypothetical protein